MSNQFDYDRFRRILDIAEKKRHCVSMAEGYAEPGYDDNDNPICFANWNSQGEDDTMPRIAKLLESMGCELEWEDEWLVCECGKAFRCSPDCYSWRMYGYIGDGDYACGDCIKDDPEDYLEYCAGNPSQCLTLDINMEELGYVNLNKDSEEYPDRFESGWHPGQNDDPREIGRKLKDIGINDYVFSLDSTGQFDISYSVWVKKEHLNPATVQ